MSPSWRALAAGALLLVPCATASAQRRDRRAYDEPRPMIYRAAGGVRVDLPAPIEDALDRYDPDFEPWTDVDYARSGVAGAPITPRQTPWAVIGDFNGDGRQDVAIAGRTDRDASVLLVLSRGRSAYRAVELEREPYDPEDPSTILLPVLQLRYPGRYVVADPRLFYPREIVVDRPAVQVDGAGRESTRLYVVEARGVTPYYLSDRPLPPPRRAIPGPPGG